MFPRVLSRDQACCCFGVVFSGALLFLGQSKERTSCQSFKLHCHTNILFGRWGGGGGETEGGVAVVVVVGVMDTGAIGGKSIAFGQRNK